jgi:hypothetical protein
LWYHLWDRLAPLRNLPELWNGTINNNYNISIIAHPGGGVKGKMTEITPEKSWLQSWIFPYLVYRERAQD